MAKTILIVEDNELNMKLFNDLLQAHGYETVQTKDGRDALDLGLRLTMQEPVAGLLPVHPVPHRLKVLQNVRSSHSSLPQKDGQLEHS